jgi:hypothetical protein
MVTFDPVAQ